VTPIKTESAVILIDHVALIVEMPGAEAVALAKFLKSLSIKVLRQYASDETACREIRAAVDKLKYALADAYRSPPYRFRK
jgi:uncharacterized protein (UPF0147 family)